MNTLRALVMSLGLLMTTQSLAFAPAADDPICLLKSCAVTLLQCGIDEECRNWLGCVRSCGDDKIKCPSTCGFFYQSDRINKTSQCVFDSRCVDLGFGSLPNYEHDNRPMVPLQKLSGTYWFAASHGGTHIFDYDCQRFDFTNADQTGGPVQVTFSVPLTLNGSTRLTGAHGTFTPLNSGAVEVAYENFSGYHERWYLLDQTPDTLLAHVCIDAGSICYDYGTVLLSKRSLSEVNPDALQQIDRLTRAHDGIGISAFKTSRVEGCVH